MADPASRRAQPAQEPHAPGGLLQPPRFLAVKRALFAAATAFVTANIWTGCPLLALWVGSQAVALSRLPAPLPH